MTTKKTNLIRSISLVSVLGLSLNQASYALQEISEESMSQVTGEGIALLPTDFSFQLNGATTTGSTSSAKTYVSDNSNVGTGYIHLIPVGPLSQSIQTANATATNKTGKADVYIYGLALSKNDNNVNTRYSGTNISSWGSTANPWVIKVLTNKSIPNFAGKTQAVSYLSLEAPLYDNSGTSDDYNLKFGAWADLFVRDPSKIEGDAAEFCLNGASSCKTSASHIIANRLRLQTIWNGLSINGSNIKLFQTQDGSSTASYNNTLGLAALIRLNTLSQLGTGDITVVDLDSNGNKQYNSDGSIKTKTKTLTKNTADTNGVLRLSTQELATSPNVSNILYTPAIDGGAVPVFGASEGLYLYNTHVNLVLGTLYQPLILGIAPDGKNIVLELTRIPNVAAVYNQIYTDYNNLSSSTVFGSTCSQFECGNTTASTTGSIRNPTHSSITIGDVGYDASTKSIMADTSATAKGVTFKDISGNAVNLGSVAIDGVLIQHFKITTKGL